MAEQNGACARVVNFCLLGWLHDELCMSSFEPVLAEDQRQRVMRVYRHTAETGSREMDIVPAGVTVAPPTTAMGGFVQGDKAKDMTRSPVNIAILEPLYGKESTFTTSAT